MKNWQRLPSSLASLACLGLLMSPFAAYCAERSSASNIQDVALGDGGVLTGMVVNAQGNAVPNAKLEIRSSEHLLVNTQSAKDGKFRVRSLRGGVYQCVAEEQTTVLRLWANETAPPSAIGSATLVTGPIVRGQSCTTDSCTGACGGVCDGGGGGLRNAPLAFLLNPIVLGAAAAAAVAIPLANEDNEDDDNAS